MLLVVLEHAHGNLIAWPNAAFDTFNRHFNGAAGVDLFFAISGFVIARVLLPRLAACNNHAAFIRTSIAFWIRRAWRILPSAWLWLAIILTATWGFNRSGAFGSFDATAAGSIAAVLQFYNLHFAHCFMSYDCGANFFYWSLSLEEQFYLVLPLLIFLCRRHPRGLVTVLIGLVLLQLLTQRSLLGVTFRTDALLLGVLIAIAASRNGERRQMPNLLVPPRFIRSPLTLALLAAIAAAATSDWTFAPYRFGIVALLSAFLVWLASFDASYLMATSPTKRVLLWIGSRSYAIYLIHVPAFFATRELWFRSAAPGTTFDASWTLPFVLSAVTLIGVLAELNYRLVESPLRQHGTTIAARYAARSPSAAT